MDSKENKDLLLDIYGGKTFVKIYQAIEIGKIKFSFAEKENPKEGIDIYLDADIFNSDLIDAIATGDLRTREAKERARAKAASEQYCKAIWESPVGVTKDNKMRKFEIQPGIKTEFAFRATEEKKSIIVGCDNRAMKLLVERWRFLKPDYEVMMRNRYSLANMKSDYRSTYVETTPVVNIDEPDELPIVPNKDVKVTTKTAPAPSTIEEAPPKEKAKVEVKDYRVKVSIPLADMKDGKKALKAVTEDNKEVPVIFGKSLFSKPEWKEFEMKCSKAGSLIRVKGAIINGMISVSSIVA